MTSAQSALVKIAATEFTAGDFAGALVLADPLIRWDDRALDADGDLVWGREDVLAHLGKWLDGWEDYSSNLEDIREFGDRTVVVYSESGLDRTTGMRLQQRRAAVVTVERGTIVAWARYLTEGEAERAATAGEVRRF